MKRKADVANEPESAKKNKQEGEFKGRIIRVDSSVRDPLKFAFEKRYIRILSEVQQCLVDQQGNQLSVLPAFGAGMYGDIYPVEGKDPKAGPMVLKIIRFWDDDVQGAYTEKQFALEAAAGEVAGKLGVGPQVFDSWICQTGGDKTGFILMERLMDMIPLRDLRDMRTPRKGGTATLIQVMKLLLPVVDKLYHAGWLHGDLHRSNIMVKEDLTAVRLLDFGRAIKVVERKEDPLRAKDKPQGESIKLALEQKLITPPVTKALEAQVSLVYKVLRLRMLDEPASANSKSTMGKAQMRDRQLIPTILTFVTSAK